MVASRTRASVQLLASGTFGCSEEVATIAAMLSVQVRPSIPSTRSADGATHERGQPRCDASPGRQNVFIVPAKMRKEAAEEHIKFAVKEGDHLTLYNGTSWLCGLG